jgi:MFS family permease
MSSITSPTGEHDDPDSTRLFRRRSFALFWCSRLFSTLSFQICSVAVGWQVYALTGSAFALGMVGLAQFVPMAVLTLAAGHAADRYDRRSIIRICQAVEAGAAAMLALGSFEGWLNTTHIFIAAGAIGAARSFESPTLLALLPGLIPPQLLPRAAALSSSANQTARIIGPALGGLLYAAGPTAPYLVAAFLYLSAGAMISLIRLERVPPPMESRGFRSVFSGISFIRKRPAVLGAISLDLFAVLLGGATALLPIYAKDILGTEALGLGILRSGPALGALCMSLFLGNHSLDRRVGMNMFAGVIVFGLATVVFAVSRNFYLSVAALAVMGAADVISVVVRTTLVQIATPDHMRGRVSAINFLFVGTSNQLGEFESGVTASLFGVVPAAVIGGVGTVCVALLWMLIFPELRNIDSFEGMET